MAFPLKTKTQNIYEKQIDNLFDLAFFRVAVNYCVL